MTLRCDRWPARWPIRASFLFRVIASATLTIFIIGTYLVSSKVNSGSRTHQLAVDKAALGGRLYGNTLEEKFYVRHDDSVVKTTNIRPKDNKQQQQPSLFQNNEYKKMLGLNSNSRVNISNNSNTGSDRSSSYGSKVKSDIIVKGSYGSIRVHNELHKQRNINSNYNYITKEEKLPAVRNQNISQQILHQRHPNIPNDIPSLNPKISLQDVIPSLNPKTSLQDDIPSLNPKISLQDVSYTQRKDNVKLLSAQQNNARPSKELTPSAHASFDDTSRDQDDRLLSNSTNRGSQGVVPVKCDPQNKLSEVYTMPNIKYLPGFKNPCWYEQFNKPIEDLYKENGFAKYSKWYEKAFDKLKDKWGQLNKTPDYRLRCLPYFFLAGQPKCGSTDLYRKLIAHPDIATPPIKESHWWGKNRYGWRLNYTRNIPFSDYVDIYDTPAAKIEQTMIETDADNYHPVITGDASVSTLWSNDNWWKNSENCGLRAPLYTNAHHVHRLLPTARIIVILRNPTDRLYSDFLYFQTTNAVKGQNIFHEEVKKAISSLDECIQNVGIRACVYNTTIANVAKVRLRVGLYSVYLQEWLALFPRDQVKVIRLEDYAKEPLKVMRGMHDFLDLRALSQDETESALEQPQANTRRKSDRQLGKMLDKTRTLLDTFYRPYNQELAGLMADDTFLWEE